MSVNLVSLASQYLTPEIMTRMASTLGVESGVLARATSAAIPAILGSFANLASTRDGARRLFGAVSEQGQSILQNLPQAIGEGQRDLIDSGFRTLSSLLGNSTISALTSAIARFSGIGHSTSSSLIGMLSPILMGVLGKQVAEKGLDAAGFGQLLTSQRDNIMAAMPSAFRDMLRSPEFSALSMAGAGQRAAGAATSTVSRAADYTRRAQASSSWGSPLLWILPLLAIGALTWWLLSNRTNVAEQRPTQPQPQVAQTKPVVTQPQVVQRPQTEAIVQETVTVGGVDLRSKTQKTLDGVRSALSEIKDESSAQLALPKLQVAAGELDDVIKLAGQLPRTGKQTLVTVITTARPATNELMDKVEAMPGANAVAKPAIEAIKARINELGKTAG